MSDTEHVPEIDEEPSAVLPVACLACGYDLRGLASPGSCPECGRNIDESRSRGTLRRAGAIWLKHFATYLILVAAIALVLAGMYWLSVYTIVRVSVFTSFPRLRLPGWYEYAHVAATVIDCAVVWLVTRVPPFQSDGSDEGSMRMWIRFFAVCNALVIGFVAMDLVARSAGPLRTTWMVCLNSFAAAEAWLFWTYLARCVDRIPDERLVHRCHSVKWGQTVGLVFGPLLGTLIHRQMIFTQGFRIFAPMPGRICLMAYEWIGIVLLVRIAQRVVQLKSVRIISL